MQARTFHEGDEISIDGSTGNIYEGIIPTVDASIAGTFGRIMGWADEFRTLKVRTNADTPADAKKARELGAEGIGLCRTEHMFFEETRIAAFREMICADTVEEREAALDKILPYQQGDFEKLYEALEGCPVTIRFLDPPLHEFVPTEEEDIEKLAAAQGKSVEDIKAIIASLHEFNPMMGHRGLSSCSYISRNCKDANKGCYPRSYQCSKGSSGLDSSSRNHDSAFLAMLRSLNMLRMLLLQQLMLKLQLQASI